jgi:hypothetical protein
MRASRIGMFVSVLALCAPFTGSIPSFAAPPSELNKNRLDKIVRYLQQAQNSDGGFGGEAGQESSQLFSAWVALALAAASINPQDQTKPGGLSAYSYLTRHVQQAIREELCKPIVCTTAFERELLVADASGTSAKSYGGVDLLHELLARKLPDGSFPFVPGGHGEVNDTIFAVLSLSPIAEPATREAVKLAAEWVIGQQNTDGSWSWQKKGSPGEADMTGAAIEALNAAGMPNTEAQGKAITYLHEIQEPDGGFPEFPSEGESNSGSTAWATQGIWAAGENPEAPSWVQSSTGHGPLDYLEVMQQTPDGHIRYGDREELNGLWMTAYAGPAYAGQPLPVRAPARNPETSAPSNLSGQGGESSESGSGVIAGGDGDGANLFSRPQAASKGHTPGGSRQLKRSRDAGAKRRRDPGPREKAPAPTATSAGAHQTRKKTRSQAGRKRSGAIKLTGAGSGGGGGSQSSTGETIKGLLIGAPTGAPGPGAPGLHSAGAGVNGPQWPAVALAAAALLLALSGWLIELRRPHLIL